MAMRPMRIIGLALPAALVLSGTAAGAAQAAPSSNAQPSKAQSSCGSRATSPSADYAQTTGTATASNRLFDDSTADGSDVSVSGGVLNLSHSTVDKTGDSTSGDDSSFEGLNAAVLAQSGGTVNLSSTNVVTDGYGANGVYDTGTGSLLNMYGCSVTTTADGSHGADATGGATLNLHGVTINTSGSNSSAIATDRGGGYVTVYGGSATARGAQSAGVYSTGVITVYDAVIDSTSDEGAVMDGSNQLNLHRTALTGTIGGIRLWNTLPFPETTPGEVTLDGGSVTVTAGDAFDAINSLADFTLRNTVVKETGDLLKATSGATASLSGSHERLVGDVTADATSTASVALAGASVLTGAVSDAALSLSRNSVWRVTGDSVLTSLSDVAVSGTRVTNIVGDGHTVTYDASLTASSALDGLTYRLVGGGVLTPAS